MTYITRLTLFILSILSTTTTYSQQRNSVVKFVTKNQWITDDILSDTIELTRIRPFKRYGLIKIIIFKKTDSRILYGYTSKPKKSYWTCGTGELDVDMNKSNFQILDNGGLMIEIYASMFSDKSYNYHYIKEFKCEQLSKDKWRLITVNSKVNDLKIRDFN